MFLTTSGAAFTGSSITALSQVINNNHPTNTSTSSSSLPRPAAGSSSQQSQGKSASIKSKFSRGRKEHALTPRPTTSTSITSSTSLTSSHNTADSSAVRATSVASSVTSSIANRVSTSSSTTNTTPASTPASTPALSAKSSPSVASPGGSSIQNPFEQVNTVCTSTEVHPETNPAEDAADSEDSMRRRATESLGSNLIASSLRAVFRDNNASNPDNATSTPPVQSPAEELASLRLDDDTSLTRNLNNASSSLTSGTPAAAAEGRAVNAAEMPSIKFIPHQDQRSSRPSLAFAPMTRTLPNEGTVIRVGRYSERDNSPNANILPSSAPIGFKSKVVSRRHCEFWCSNGQWFVKDVKSSSGTFLNHIRLSQPSTESKPFPINDGDIVQLGMDFRGGEESIFRCVKIRIEVNRGWQKKLNDFNTTTHKALRALSKETSTTSSTECSICLMSISPCQALFVAPCSHVWHYKCIRPVINNPKMYPQFLCPNCRAVADLEADIDEVVDGWDEADVGETSAGGAENRAATPINILEDGDDGQENASGAPVPAIREAANDQDAAANHNSDNAHQEMQDDTIIFSEPSPIHIRDPRTIPDSLEGVLTPRNEAGPFVFDGSGRRLEVPTVST